MTERRRWEVYVCPIHGLVEAPLDVYDDRRVACPVYANWDACAEVCDGPIVVEEVDNKTPGPS